LVKQRLRNRRAQGSGGVISDLRRLVRLKLARWHVRRAKRHLERAERLAPEIRAL
jgi:transposase